MSKKYQTPHEALQKLKIASGGRGSTEVVYDGLMISLSEIPRGRRSDHPYEISVLFGNRRTSIELSRDDLVTKGKSMWPRDNTWRLKTETVNRFDPEISSLVLRLMEKELK